MATSKKAIEVLRSPAGRAAYAWLREPDTGRELSDDRYKVTLVLPKSGDEKQEEIDAMISRIRKAHEAARGKKKTEGPVRDGDEADKEEFENCWLVRFKSKRPPALVDARKARLPDGVNIYSGDIIKVAFVIFPYEKGKNAGVTLGLRAVQLIEKNSSFVGGGEDVFDEEEGFDAGGAQSKKNADSDEDDSDFE